MIKISSRVSSISPSMTLAVSAKANRLKAEGKRIINFGVGEPDFNTPAHIVQAAKKALDMGLTKYVAAAGLPALKQAVCKKLKTDNGLEYSPEQIVICNGAKHAIFNALFAVIDQGDEVIIPSPYWLTYPEAVKSCGGVPVIVPTSRQNGYKLTAEQLEGALTPNSKLLILNTPSNPTGAVYGEDELKKIAYVCQKHGLLVLSDEIYEKLVYGGKTHCSIARVSPGMQGQTIVVNGLSKSYAMTGWRVGYLACDGALAGAIASFQSHATSNVNTIAQYAALAALEGDQTPMREMVSAFESRLNYMLNLLDDLRAYGLDYVKPQGAFYVMLITQGLYGKSFGGDRVKGSLDLANALLTRAGVAVTPGICFGDDSFIRLSYALSPEDIAEGVRKIAGFAAELK